MLTPAAPLLDALASRIKTLPSLPYLAVRLMSSLEDESMDLSALLHEIEQDPALVARALCVANSPFYGLSGHVDRIGDAVMLIGMKQMRSIVLATLLQDQMSLFDPTGERLRKFWLHAALVASTARNLTRLCGYARADTAFTAGLLHDIGSVVFLAVSKGEKPLLFETDDTAAAFLEGEVQLFGATHAQTGAMLARHWHLPGSLIEAIGLHHKPAEMGDKPLVAIVHVADIVAIEAQLGGDLESMFARLEPTALDLLGITGAEIATLFDGAANQLASNQLNITGD